MASVLQVENTTTSNQNTYTQGVKRPPMKDRPADFRPLKQEHDRLRNPGLWTKVKIGIDTASNTPDYAYRGMKGDPDFNFYEQQKVSKIPYYLGGIGLAAVCLAGRNILDPDCVKGNKFALKKVALGALFYYIAREVANAAINIPVKLFRGIDLNMPYRKITALREANPLNLPNNKKPSNQNVFESTEFTRWDLLYKYGSDKNVGMNETFDKMAKKFGVKHKQNDSDSKVIGKIKKLIIMATSWKYMLAVPFVMTALGMAQQKAFENNDFTHVFKSAGNILNNFGKDSLSKFGTSFYKNIITPIGKSFIELWKGNSTASKILGRSAIIASVGLAILANTMILSKTSLKHDTDEIDGGNK